MLLHVLHYNYVIKPNFNKSISWKNCAIYSYCILTGKMDPRVTQGSCIPNFKNFFITAHLICVKFGVAETRQNNFWQHPYNDKYNGVTTEHDI